MSSDVNDRDDERTDPHIAAPKSPPASAAPPRAAGPPQRLMPAAPAPGTPTTTGTVPRMPARPSDPGLRITDPARPPILPTRTATAAAPPPSERASDVPPTSSLTAAMLIPRPSQPPPLAGRASDPGPSGSGDPLRERLAQVEVQSAATRSIASRVEAEASRAHARLDAIDPRVGALESSLRDRVAQLEASLDAARRTLESRVEQVLAGARPASSEEPADAGSLKTALATMRHTLAEHERLFEARRARLESLDARVATVEGDARLVELRRATESFDLRLVALERAQDALRGEVDARLRAIEARLTEGPATTGAKKSAPAEAELRRVKGLGPKYEKALRELGITTLAQVAAWTDEDLARVSVALAVPTEKLRKLGWPEIARALLASE